MEERLRSEKWKRYEEFLVEGEKSPATVRKYIHDIQTFYLWLEEKELSKETLKEYKSWLSEHYKISSCQLHGHKPEFISEVLRPCRVLSENL